MSQFFYIHPENPQARLINQAVEILRQRWRHYVSDRFGLCLGLYDRR